MNPSTSYINREENSDEEFPPHPEGFLPPVYIKCPYCHCRVIKPCPDAKCAQVRCGVDPEGEPSDPIDPKHYNGLEIEPIEFISKNKLPFAEGNVVKYIVRHGMKGGAEDVRKAIQYCKFILKYSYGIEEV